MSRQGISPDSHTLISLKDELGKIHPIQYPKDCEVLSEILLDEKNIKLSVTSIKRLFGFAKSTNRYSLKILDNFSKACHFKNWEQFESFHNKIKDNQLPELWNGSEANPYIFIKHTASLQSLLFQFNGKEVVLIPSYAMDTLELILGVLIMQGRTGLWVNNVDEDHILNIGNKEVVAVYNNQSLNIKSLSSYTSRLENHQKLLWQCLPSQIPQIEQLLSKQKTKHYIHEKELYLSRGEIRKVLANHGITISFDRTTRQLENTLSNVTCLKRFIDFYLNQVEIKSIHPNILALRFGEYFLEQQETFSNLLKEIKDLSDEEKLKLKALEYLKTLGEKLDANLADSELLFYAIVYRFELSNCEEDLYLAYRVKKKLLTYNELNHPLAKHSLHDQLAHTANICHYLYTEESRSYLSYEQVFLLCARTVIDYRNLDHITPSFYGKLLEIGNQEQKLMALSMLILHCLKHNKTDGLESLLSQVESLLQVEGTVHILPYSRAVSALYMGKNLMGNVLKSYPSPGKNLQFFAHFSLELPIQECFELMAYIYTKEWHKAYAICEKIKLKNLVKIEFTTGILKLLYAQMYFVYQHLNKPEKAHELRMHLDEVPECCFYMETLVDELINAA